MAYLQAIVADGLIRSQAPGKSSIEGQESKQELQKLSPNLSPEDSSVSRTLLPRIQAPSL